jgi:hypothetical protein
MFEKILPQSGPRSTSDDLQRKPHSSNQTEHQERALDTAGQPSRRRVTASPSAQCS